MKYKILMVDDDRELLKMLNQYFTLKNYTVIIAENGIEAMEKISVNPDIILLDVNIIAHLKREERLHRKKEQRFYGELVIDYASKCAHIKGNALELTKLEYEIIEFLSMNPEMVFDKERIYEKISGYDTEGDSRVVTELIRRIRNKIKRYTKHEYIETVWGMGYKWKK